MDRILIADESECFCRALCRRLAGYEVHICRTGRDAIEALEEFSPDLLVINLHLPNTHGLEVLRQLRRRLPIIALTTLPTPAVCDAAAACGVELLVAIPCSPGYLAEEIRRRLNKKVPSPDV